MYGGRLGINSWLAHNGLRTTLQVAPGGQVTAIDTDDGFALRYGYDDRARITSVDRNGTEHQYAYEGQRLIFAKDDQSEVRYHYDAVGNRLTADTQLSGGEYLSESYVYPQNGEGNRLLERNHTQSGLNETYVYDSAGSPIRRGDLVTNYDAERRPVEIQRNGERVARYAYNGFGERIKKVVYSAGNSPKVTYFLYNNHRLIAEVDQASEAITQYVYLESHRPVAKLAGDAIYAIHTDHLGTPIRMSDSDGEVVWSTTYSAFGEAQVESASTESLPLRLPGQYFDEETGTHYNYFRDYDPKTGRYLTSDPIGLGGGINTYAYLSGNPTNSIDPLGLAQFGVRPLGGLPDWLPVELPVNPIGDAGNVALVHEQLFFDNPVVINGVTYGNIGLFSTGSVQCGPGEIQEDDPLLESEYVLYGPIYDDNLMVQALINLGGPGPSPSPYCLIGNNCQNFGDDLRAEYARLENLQQVP